MNLSFSIAWILAIKDFPSLSSTAQVQFATVLRIPFPLESRQRNSPSSNYPTRVSWILYFRIQLTRARRRCVAAGFAHNSSKFIRRRNASLSYASSLSAGRPTSQSERFSRQLLFRVFLAFSVCRTCAKLAPIDRFISTFPGARSVAMRAGIAILIKRGTIMIGVIRKI